MAGQNIHKAVDFHLKEGALHNELHVKSGAKIPLGKEEKALRAAKKDGNTTEEKRVVFAMNARHFHHGG